MSTSTAVENLYVMRYMGNKRKLLDVITEVISDRSAPGEVVVDLMAGTHAVGHALCRRNRIVANDIGPYSLPIGRALMMRPEGFQPDAFLNIIAQAAAENHMASNFTFFQTRYADTYFSENQCGEIDDLRYAVEILDLYDSYAADLALAALISAMCYAQSTPGHFAQFMPADHKRIKPLRGISIMEQFSERFRQWPIEPASHDHEVLNADWRAVFTAGFSSEARVVYVDPPYNTEQYSRFYHVLETVTRYDYPQLAHKARYREGRFKSNFSYKRTVQQEFHELFQRCAANSEADVVLSYSSTGIVTREQFAELCCPYYRLVDLVEVDHPHSTQGKGMKNGVSELILTFKKQ
jgi:adenine-specific DNA-methyltransferase